MLDKTRGLAVDCVAYDLEDSVTHGRKAEARHNIRQMLQQPPPHGIRESAVRINGVHTAWAEDDLTAVVRSPRHNYSFDAVHPLLTILASSV